MKRRFILLGILIVCLFGSGNLFGDGMLFIGLQGGWSQQNIDIRDIEFDRDTKFLYGARAGIRILTFVVEGNFYQASHDMKASDIGDLWETQKTNLVALPSGCWKRLSALPTDPTPQAMFMKSSKAKFHVAAD